MNTQAANTTGLEIAIVGMAGRFPGAETLEQFWQNLQSGIESVTTFSEAQLIENGVDPALVVDPNYVKAEATIAGIADFDAEFFGFSPREAEILDPQHRLFLECAWEALEHAGYDPEQEKGAIALYAGAAANPYFLNLYTNAQIRQSVSHYQLFIANDKDFLTTRVSYKLNLQGPSLDIQTACSTSLVAVHIACQSLLSGECDMALAGGVSVAQPTGYLYQEGGIYSPDGHCRPFDASAKGTIAGNGLGIVVLKRLEDALSAGDRIHAVIKGSAVNNDGSRKVSYTAPRIESQAAVIRAAQVMAEVDPETITFIEAHGTGTSLGDPIEIAALTQAFRLTTQKQRFCAIASAKSNIGHLDAAAGVASLIKTVLSLQHQQIPPSLHFTQANPQIDFENSPFYVNHTLSDWRSQSVPRRAGVSSFGIGGTNAHVIVEEAPSLADSGSSRSWQLLLLSAKTPTALTQMMLNLSTHLKQHPELKLADVAYTLQLGRRAFEHRQIVLCQTVEDAIVTLDAQTLFSQPVENSRSLVWMFPGQGSQYHNMGRELYETEAVFQEILDKGCGLVRSQIGIDLRSILYSEKDSKQINQTQFAQVAIFLVEYSLAQLWLSWGVRPEAMIGHSIGEYVAATLAGVFSFEDALSLVTTRAGLMQQCEPGAMLSVCLSEEAILPWLSEEISLAAVNSSQLCVLSGRENAIAQLESDLTAKDIACRRLQTSHAFHSPLVESVLEPFTQAFKSIRLNAPKIPVMSNLTGTWLTAEQATDPAYWASHLRQAVRFSTGIAELLQQTDRIFLEIGAGRTLTTLVKQHSPHEIAFTSLRHPQEDQSDTAFILSTLGQLWLNGITINWSDFYANEVRHRVPLPTYPFQRQRYWVQAGSQTVQPSNPVQSSWLYAPTWERETLPLNVDRSLLTAERHCWLVLLDELGIGAELVQIIQATGQDVITVTVGACVEQIGYRKFAINPESKQDWRELLEDLQLRELLPTRIVHLWSLASSTGSYNGFYSLLNLAQVASQLQKPMQVTLITNQIQSVLGTEQFESAKSTVLGLAKVINQELESLTCHCIDVVLDDPKHLAQQLLSDLLTPNEHTAVAYRGAYRWNQEFKPVQTLQDATDSVGKLRLNGNYLILGDFVSGLGLVWARMLAKTVQANLTLIGNGDRSIAADLDAEGIHYQFISAEITEQTQLEAAIAQVETMQGQIHGVFYSTPMSGDHSTALLSQLSPILCQQTFQAKLEGLFVLANVLRDRKIDFCLLQSSLSSVLGGLGLGAYAAANTAIDAFALQQSQTGTPWMSINWDACRDDQTNKSSDTFGADLATFALTTSEVERVTRQALSLIPMPQIVVSKGALTSRIEQWIRQPLKPDQPLNLKSRARPALKSSYIAPQTEAEQAIAKIWQDLLGIEQIGVSDNFFELGGHSLLAIQAISRLRDRFGVELPMRSLLETPTIAGIAALITEQAPNPDELAVMGDLIAEIQQLSSEEIQHQLSIQTIRP
jgi:acyl transferase domain-containing protein